jgi:hypothetical protein
VSIAPTVTRPNRVAPWAACSAARSASFAPWGVSETDSSRTSNGVPSVVSRTPWPGICSRNASASAPVPTTRQEPWIGSSVVGAAAKRASCTQPSSVVGAGGGAPFTAGGGKRRCSHDIDGSWILAPAGTSVVTCTDSPLAHRPPAARRSATASSPSPAGPEASSVASGGATRATIGRSTGRLPSSRYRCSPCASVVATASPNRTAPRTWSKRYALVPNGCAEAQVGTTRRRASAGVTDSATTRQSSSIASIRCEWNA